MLRIVAGGGYLSHTEPICKHMQLLKVADMLRVALWLFFQINELIVIFIFLIFSSQRWV